MKIQDATIAYTLTRGFHPLDVASGPEVVPAETDEDDAQRKCWNEDPGIDNAHEKNHTRTQEETLHKHTTNTLLS